LVFVVISSPLLKEIRVEKKRISSNTASNKTNQLPYEYTSIIQRQTYI
jgi:hypothetical protein